MKKQIAIVTAVLAVVLFAVHLYASAHGWYDTRIFFDKYMHFLGGAFVFFALAMYFLRHAPPAAAWFTGRQLLVLILFVLIVGLLWEGFEYAVQLLTGTHLVSLADSIGDVVFDLLGSVVASLMLFLVQYN